MSVGNGVSTMRESPILEAALHHDPANLRFCLDCGLAICADRLAAVPRALRCLECQHRFEDARSAEGADVDAAPEISPSRTIH